MIKKIILLLLILTSFAHSKTIEEKVQVRENFRDIDISVEVYVQNKPAPTIIALHHCAGIDRFIHYWAERYQDLGFNVVIPDSFSPRGLTNVCETSNKEILRLRNYDLEYVAKWVHKQSWHSGKLGVVGWSHGGRVVLEYAENEKIVGLIDSAVSYYGGCINGNHALIPVQIHIGNLDDWTPAGNCPNFNNPKVGVNIYPNSYHSFDVFLPSRNYKGHHLEYNAISAETAQYKTQLFFDKTLVH